MTLAKFCKKASQSITDGTESIQKRGNARTWLSMLAKGKITKELKVLPRRQSFCLIVLRLLCCQRLITFPIPSGHCSQSCLSLNLFNFPSKASPVFLLGSLHPSTTPLHSYLLAYLLLQLRMQNEFLIITSFYETYVNTHDILVYLISSRHTIYL